MLAGMAGMSEAEFWGCTLRYLYNRLEGYRKAREMDVQAKYEVARYNAMLVLSPNVKKGKSLKVTDLGKFDWELTEKERKAMEREPLDEKRFKELQAKLEKGLQEGTIKWEPVKDVV